ncbi:hypothetical protein [Flavobacterium sp. U410]
MKFARLIVLVTVLSSALIGCSDNCSDVNAPDSSSLFLEFVDQTTEENVFENEMFTSDQIVITDADDELVSFNFVVDKNFIHVTFPAGILTDEVVYVTLENTETSETREIEVHLSTIAQEEECYILYKTDNVQFPNNESALVDGIYRVKI